MYWVIISLYVAIFISEPFWNRGEMGNDWDHGPECTVCKGPCRKDHG